MYTNILHLHAMSTPRNCTKQALIVGLPGFNKPGLWKSFQDIERSKQWGEMALGFPWQLLQAAKRAALKTYVRLDWYVHSEPSNRFSVQPITLSRTVFTVLTFDLLSVSGLLPLLKNYKKEKEKNFRLWWKGEMSVWPNNLLMGSHFPFSNLFF